MLLKGVISKKITYASLKDWDKIKMNRAKSLFLLVNYNAKVLF